MVFDLRINPPITAISGNTERIMRQILLMVRQMMGALAATAVTWVKRGGKWVLERLPGGSPAAMPAPMPVIGATSASPAVEVAPIRRIAGIFAQGKPPQPADLAGIDDRHLAWLRQLNRMQLCRVLAARDDQILAHVKGSATLRLVPPADVEAIAQLKAAREARRQEAMAARPAQERRAEVERQIMQMETGSAIPAM